MIELTHYFGRVVRQGRSYQRRICSAARAMLSPTSRLTASRLAAGDSLQIAELGPTPHAVPDDHGDDPACVVFEGPAQLDVRAVVGGEEVRCHQAHTCPESSKELQTLLVTGVRELAGGAVASQH
jgi:hypothetical protein